MHLRKWISHAPQARSPLSQLLFSFFLRSPSFSLNGSFQQVLWEGRLGVQPPLGGGARSQEHSSRRESPTPSLQEALLDSPWEQDSSLGTLVLCQASTLHQSSACSLHTWSPNPPALEPRWVPRLWVALSSCSHVFFYCMQTWVPK